MIDLEKETKKKKQGRKFITYIRLYVIPLITLVAFFAILVTLVIPKIQGMFDGLNEITLTNTQIEERDAKIIALRELASVSLTTKDQLRKVNEIAPIGQVEVVNFRDKITKIAQDSGLRITQQRLSEGDLEAGSKKASLAQVRGDLVLQEVPTLFQVVGSFDSINDFLDKIDTVEDFIVIKQMKLGGGEEGTNEWKLELTLVKYQFNIADGEKLKSAYQSVPLDAEVDEFVVDYLSKKN